MAQVITACQTCRRRKVRCDGALPCHNCRNAKIPTECLYLESRADLAGVLKRGTACQTCRNKKRKCDGKRPVCSTCIANNMADFCVFDSQALIRAESAEVANYSESPSSAAQTSVSEAEAFEETHLNVSHVDDNLIAYRSPSSSRSNYETQVHLVVPSTLPNLHENDYKFQIRPPDILQADYAPLIFDPHALTSDFVSHHHSLTFRQIPNQYAETFFRHQIQLGLLLSSSRMEAIRTSDLSGRFIHPVLVHVAHLCGAVFWQQMNKIQRYDDEMAYLKLASDMITASRQPGGNQNADPVAFLQAQYILTLYSFFRMKVHAAIAFHRGAAQTVTEHKLHIFDAAFLQPDFAMTEEAQALCVWLLVDRVQYNPVKMDPLLSSRLVEELNTCLTLHSQVCMNDIFAVRACSTLLFLKVREVIAADKPGEDAALNLPDIIKYFDLLTQINTILASVNSSLVYASFRPSYILVEIALKISAVLLLASAAVVCRHLAVTYRHAECQRKAVDSVMEIVSTSRSYTENDYDLLDPAMLICWKEAADILQDHLDASGGLLSNAERQSLCGKVAALNGCRESLKVAMPFLERESLYLTEIDHYVGFFRHAVKYTGGGMHFSSDGEES